MSRPFSPPSASTDRSNLENFLHSMTPIVPSKVLPRSCMKEIDNSWLLDDKDTVEFFTLGDVWEAFDEWSVYGVGTPVVIGPGRNVMHYYVPYLSAIQIYTTRPSTIVSNLGEDTDATERDDVMARSLSKNSKKTWDGYLYFQYHDFSSPYWRIPLADKIRELMPKYPRLGSLKSVDLSPASWMSVAWYPIYQIPTKWYVKDLATCFLTYHTLSASFQEYACDFDCSHNAVEATYSSKAMEEPNEKFQSQIALPPFGLATYRMQGDLWTNRNKYDEEKLSDLKSAADSWLKQLDFHHHDFHFYKMHDASLTC